MTKAAEHAILDILRRRGVSSPPEIERYLDEEHTTRDARIKIGDYGPCAIGRFLRKAVSAGQAYQPGRGLFAAKETA